ncbi:MAG: aldehyde dehydrogenase family protein [Sphingomonas sp.]
MATIDSTTGRARLTRSDLLTDRAYVDGEWIAAASGLAIEVDDPFTGKVVGSIPSLSQAEVQRAVDAAERAFPAWARALSRTRGAILRRWFELVMAHQEDLARLITLENGKPLREARAEVAYGAGFIEFYADEAGRMLGEIIPANVPGRRLLVEREPVGVCAAITPWNFPLAMLTRKAAPAFAAGCTIVAKPASQTPLTALALAVLAEEAGVPPGVLNVVTGKASMIGGLLTASPVVRKISFTGSTEIGAQLMAESQGKAIAEATRVSNPGCWPTGFLIMVRPLVRAGLVPHDWPLVYSGASGYSGGGKAMIAEFEDAQAKGFERTAYRAYGLSLAHKHLPEMHKHARIAAPPLFLPAVARAYRGLLAEVALPLHALPRKPSLATIETVLREAYKDSPVIAVVPSEDVSLVRIEENAGTDRLWIRVFGNAETGQARLIATYDNLGKGAAGAAVQNLNVMAGLDPAAGLVV